MSIMLRYVKHLRRVNGVGWRVMNNHPQIKMTGVNLKHHQTQLINNNLTKSYATSVESKLDYSSFNSDLVHNFETQLNRTGRTAISDINKVLREVHSTGVMSSLTALLLIRSCGRPLFEADNPESINLVQDIWSTIVHLHVPIDVSHYNALLNVYLEKEHVYDIMKFIEKMEHDSIEPNRITYQRLIASYCQRGNLVGATKILEIMKQKELPLCENVFNSLITGHSQANDIESAVGILKMMKNTGIEPSTRTYEALLCAYAKHGDMDAIKTTMHTMNESDMNLFSTQLAEVFYAFAANGHTNLAKEFLDTYIDDIQSDTEVGRILVKLINIQRVPLAIELIKKSSKDETRRIVRSLFATRALAKNPNSPVDDLITLCTYLYDKPDQNHESRSFQTAIYYALTSHSDASFICPLMAAWKKLGGEIRTHYFWPLLKAQTLKNDYNGMLNILKIMIQDFELMPCNNTLRDYVLPYMLGGWDNVIGLLTSYKIPDEVVLIAIADRLLMEKKLKNTGMFMNMYPIKYPSDKFLHPMVEAFIIRGDPKSFIIALRLLDREIEDNINKETPVELIDAAVLELIKTIPHFHYSSMLNFLNELVTAGMSISPEVNEQVKKMLNENITSEIVEILDKLSSGTLTQVPMSEYNLYNQKYILQPAEGQTDQIELRQKFSKYLALRNTEGIIQTLKSMESVGYQSGPVWAQAIDHFCDVNNLQAATCCVNQIKNSQTNTLHPIKIMKYSTLLINNGRVDDAIGFITEQSTLEDNVKLSRGLSIAVHNLILALTENVSNEKMFEILNILKSKSYSSLGNTVLGPIVKHHIDKGDINKAFEVFQRTCTEFKCTPCKNTLTKLLIMKEDAELLQKVTDLSTDIHGEMNSLIDLAFVFVECDRVHQAQKIFQTAQISVHNVKISNIIDHFVKFNRYDKLDSLAKLFKTAGKVDHKFLYNSLLEVYININDWKKSLGLWTDMQENDIQPDALFLRKLSELLRKNNQEVPFHVPGKKEIHSKRPDEKNSRTPYEKSFDDALSRKDYEAAESEISKMNANEYDASGMYNKMISSALDDNDIDTALHVTKNVINRNYNILRATFTNLVNKLIQAERYADFDALGNLMSERLKMFLRYYKQKSRIDIKTMGLKHYLENFKLDESFDNSRYIESYIHFGGIVDGLLQDESALPLVEEWTNKLRKVGIMRSIQVIWCYHFIKNSTEAKNLWDTYVARQENLLIGPIIMYARTNNAMDTERRLFELVQDNPIAQRRIKNYITDYETTMNNSMDKSNVKFELSTDSIDLVNSDEKLSEKIDEVTDSTSDERKNSENSAVKL